MALQSLKNRELQSQRMYSLSLVGVRKRTMGEYMFLDVVLRGDTGSISDRMRSRCMMGLMGVLKAKSSKQNQTVRKYKREKGAVQGIHPQE